jgi:hypothetical protein
MMLMMMLDIHHIKLVVFLNIKHSKNLFYKQIIFLPKFFSWQTHSLVETAEKSVSNDPDNGTDLLLITWFDDSAIISDVKSNDDGHEWDFTNDGLILIVCSSQ